MIILGIDPGLARVGYGVIEVEERRGGAQHLLDCGIIRTDPGRSEGDRMVEIARDLRVLIRTWKPQLAVVEKFFFYRSSTTISVVQARGVLMMTLARLKVPVVEFPPMQIKQALTGHGHAKKDDVLDAAIDYARANHSSYTENDLRIGAFGRPKLMLSCTANPVEIDGWTQGGHGFLLEFRHIEQQMKIAREERLLDQSQANRELIRNLAHEIKNPLGGIRGAAQLLERELERPHLHE